MSREVNIAVYLALGVALPLFFYGIFALAGFFPTRFVNLPNREYWLASERKAATMRELRRNRSGSAAYSSSFSPACISSHSRRISRTRSSYQSNQS